MRQTKVYKTTKSLDEIIPALSTWIQTDLSFPEPEQTTRGETRILRSRLSGFLRQLSGLVFELTIELTPSGDGFVAEVDNGDIRKQLTALGIAWFLFWPMIFTAGWGWFANNQVLHQVVAKLDELAS